jgi:bifunctional UDP-N-acetylglucosamine pyrophosphorylase/glucosamine-1-phosphate N-acetyltransferase
MLCVILAAGRGTRMGELTNDIPKPMVSVLGEPLLAHKIRMLPESIDEVILIVGYKKDIIIGYFGAEWEGRTITYVEQTQLNGTAGAIHLVKDIVHGTFLVTMGDDLYHPDDIEKIMQHSLALLGYHIKNAASFGIVTVNEKNNLVGVVERPHGFTEGLVNTGAYVLNADFFKYDLVKISETEYGLPQTLVVMSQDYPVKVEVTKKWLPVGNPDDIISAEQFLKTL